MGKCGVHGATALACMLSAAAHPLAGRVSSATPCGACACASSGAACWLASLPTTAGCDAHGSICPCCVTCVALTATTAAVASGADAASPLGAAPRAADAAVCALVFVAVLREWLTASQNAD